MTDSVERKIRILVAKPGLDIHDRGFLLLCKAFRDAGMEVIATGLWQTAEKIAAAALEEDVDAIAISLLDGQPVPIFGEIFEVLKKKGLEDLCVFGGGIAVSGKMKPKLKEMGVAGLHGPGTPIDVIVRDVTEVIEERRKSTST